MASNTTQTIHNFILRSLGIRIKLIDFNCNEINQKTQTPFKNRFFEWMPAVVFLIFVIVYPICVTCIASDTHFQNKKKSEYFMLILNFYIRYVTFIIIFILEFVCKKRATAYQSAINLDLLQLQYVYSHWFGHLKGRTFESKNWGKTLANLTSTKTGRSLIIILIIIVFNAYFHGRITFRIPNATILQFVEAIVITTPNLCINLFILHFSDIYIQYTKIFRLLNRIMEVIADDICNNLSMCTKKRNRFKHFVVATMNQQKLNTAINHLASVLKCHNNLKIEILQMRTLYSFQLSAVILNNFVCIIIEVGAIFKKKNSTKLAVFSLKFPLTIIFSWVICSFSLFM